MAHSAVWGYFPYTNNNKIRGGGGGGHLLEKVTDGPTHLGSILRTFCPL